MFISFTSPYKPSTGVSNNVYTTVESDTVADMVYLELDTGYLILDTWYLVVGTIGTIGT